MFRLENGDPKGWSLSPGWAGHDTGFCDSQSSAVCISCHVGGPLYTCSQALGLCFVVGWDLAYISVISSGDSLSINSLMIVPSRPSSNQKPWAEEVSILCRRAQWGADSRHRDGLWGQLVHHLPSRFVLTICQQFCLLLLETWEIEKQLFLYHNDSLSSLHRMFFCLFVCFEMQFLWSLS